MNCDADLVGQWYLRRDSGEIFQVTGYDERSGTIEIQFFDGSLDEIDEDSWRALRLTAAEPPKDWTGPLDNMEADDAEDCMQASEGYEYMDPDADPEGSPDLIAEDGLDWDGWQDESEGVDLRLVARRARETRVGDGSHA
jgi:hypothetical protein